MYSGAGTSGSFGRANYAGPASLGSFTKKANQAASDKLPLTTIEANRVGFIIFPFYYIKGSNGEQHVIGALQGIAFSGVPTTIDGGGSFGRHMQTGVVKNTVEGNPTTPCLELSWPGFWRFRWIIKPGTRTLYVNVKQPTTLAAVITPTVVVKSNPSIGLLYDLSGSAVNVQTWATIGLSFSASAEGMVWVELHNNNVCEYNTPCYFDHISAG